MKIRVSQNVPDAVPTDLFASGIEPVGDSAEFTTTYVLGQFSQTVLEQSITGIGREKQVSGIVEIPAIYKTLLAKADYIDPYNDGSLFMKVGKSTTDPQNLFVKQAITGVAFPDPAEITETGV